MTSRFIHHSRRPLPVGRWPFVALTFVAGAFAQNPASDKSADQRMVDLKALAAPVALSKSSNGVGKTKDEVAAEIAAQAERARQAAQGAKDFYTANPGHPQAIEARKIEALNVVRGTAVGDPVKEQAALKLAKDFRERTDVPVKDRFEVALAADRLALSAKIKAKTAADSTVEWQLVAERLRTEFGDLPELHDYAMEIARRADLASAVGIATTVSQSNKAGPAAKARAQAVLARAALVGRSLPLKLAKIGGGEFDLAQQAGKVTVLVVWSPLDPLALEAVRRFEQILPQNSQLIYLAYGGTAQATVKLASAVPVAGVHCHAAAGTASRSASDGLKLQYGELPALYVINRLGALSGVGRFEDAPALFSNASR